MQGIDLPHAQQHGDLLVRTIGLALVDIGRGMVGVIGGRGLRHGAENIIGCAIEPVRPGALHIVRGVPDPIGARDGQGAAMQVGDRIAIGRRARDGDGEIAGIIGAIGSRRAIKRIARLQRDDDFRALTALVDEIEPVVEELSEQREDAAGRGIAWQGVLVADDGFRHLLLVAIRICDGFVEGVGGGADARHCAVGDACAMVHVRRGNRLRDHARGIIDHRFAGVGVERGAVGLRIGQRGVTVHIGLEGLVGQRGVVERLMHIAVVLRRGQAREGLVGGAPHPGARRGLRAREIVEEALEYAEPRRIARARIEGQPVRAVHAEGIECAEQAERVDSGRRCRVAIAIDGLTFAVISHNKNRMTQLIEKEVDVTQGNVELLDGGHGLAPLPAPERTLDVAKRLVETARDMKISVHFQSL